MKTSIILTLMLLGTSALAEEAGTVRLPVSAYEDLKARAAAHQQGSGDDGEVSDPRVVDATVKGLVGPKSLDLRIQLSVQGSGSGWHVLPLVPQDVALLEANITGGGSLILWEGMRALAFSGKGLRTFSARLVTSGEEAGASRQAELNVLPNISRQLSLDLANGVEAEVSPDALLTRERRTITGFIPASDGPFSVRWSSGQPRTDETPPEVEQPKQPASKEPPRINVQTSMLASVGERLLTIYTTFRYAIFHAPVSRFEWTVPAGAEVIGVQGRGVSDWTCNGDGERTCFVELPFPVQRTYELSIQVEQPLPKDLKRFTVPAPTARGVQRQSGHVAVEVMGNAEIKPADGTTAVREDVRELPADLFAGQSTPILLAFKFLEAPVNIALDIQRRDSVELSPISVDDATFTTVWTTEGRTITEGTFHVRNRQRQFLALQLPKDAVIQSAFVADAPVKPSTGEDGRIRIPLRNGGRGSEQESFVVQVVYIRDGQPLPSMGGMTAELPAMDAEIGAIHHTLVLPDQQRLWAFGGDLSIESPRVVNEATVHHRAFDGLMLGGAMQKMDMEPAAPAPQAMFDEMEQAAAEEFDARAASRAQERKRARPRRDRGGAGKMGASLSNIGAVPMDEPIPIQQALPVGNTGVLPVRIQIPTSGWRYTAHAFYVPPNKALHWTARTISSSSRSLLLGILAVLGILLGAVILRQGKALIRRSEMNREKVVFFACIALACVMTAYFRRQVDVLPGFVVLGIVGAWTHKRMTAPDQTEPPAAA